MTNDHFNFSKYGEIQQCAGAGAVAGSLVVDKENLWR